MENGNILIDNNEINSNIANAINTNEIVSKIN